MKKMTVERLFRTTIADIVISTIFISIEEEWFFETAVFIEDADTLIRHKSFFEAMMEHYNQICNSEKGKLLERAHNEQGRVSSVLQQDF